MILLIGLGNPGLDYDSTRHNAGKLFVRYLLEHPIEGIEAIETECYMNESGSWIAQMLSSRAKGQRSSTLRGSDPNGLKDKGRKEKIDFPYPLSLIPYPLFVAHDDLDIPFGKFKIQFGKGPRQHKGILSIEAELGTKEFWRVRIGIGGSQFQEIKNQKSKIKNIGEEYVLKKLSRHERKGLESLFPQIREQLQTVLGL